MAVKTGLGEGARILNIAEPFAIQRPEEKSAEREITRAEAPSYNPYAVPLSFLDLSSRTSRMMVDFYSTMWNPVNFWQKSQRTVFNNTRSVMQTLLRSLRQ
jgi:hypothetical protein